MPKVNWDDVEDKGGSYEPLPRGDYLARLDSVTPLMSAAGNEYWKLTWVIIDDRYAGRLVWDNISWAQKSLWRAKIVFSRLGFETTGMQNVEPSMLEGIQAVLTLDIDSKPAADGSEKKYNTVVADGYNRLARKIEKLGDGNHVGKPEGDDPF